MGTHHLILGTTTDEITGETLTDTHDERLRQKIARLLTGEKGYSREDVTPRFSLSIENQGRRADAVVDFVIRSRGRMAMIVRYGPGSLVTRERPALAASRLAAPYQIPVAVVTNGEDSRVLSGATGKTLGEGFDAIPSAEELATIAQNFDFPEISEKRAQMEARILYTFDFVGACNCDDGACF